MREQATDMQLSLLMDREASLAQRRDIETRLAADPQGAERLALWRRNDAALRLAALGGPPDPGLAGHDWRRPALPPLGSPRHREPPLRAVAAPGSTEAPLGAPGYRRLDHDASGCDADCRGAGLSGAVFASGVACGALALGTLLLAAWG